MKKRHLLYGTILILAILLASGCAQKRPDIVCNPPYIRFEDSCCMDQNSNNICDDDEDIMFEPVYDDSPVRDIEEDVTQEIIEETYEPEYKVLEPEEEYVEESEEEPEEEKPVSAYTATEPEPRRLDWKAENEFMNMEIDKLLVEVVSVTPRTLTDPDKKVYFKGFEITIKNKDYNYLNPKIYFSMWDDYDSIHQQSFICRPNDESAVENCDIIEEGEIRKLKIKMGERMPRIEMDKTIRITLENRRDSMTTRWLKIEETANLLDVPDITYS
jgi:hypothetical protein